MVPETLEIEPSQSRLPPSTPKSYSEPSLPLTPLKPRRVYDDVPEVKALETEVRKKWFGELEKRLHKMIDLKRSDNDFGIVVDLLDDIKNYFSTGIYDLMRTGVKRVRGAKRTQRKKRYHKL